MLASFENYKYRFKGIKLRQEYLLVEIPLSGTFISILLV